MEREPRPRTAGSSDVVVTPSGLVCLLQQAPCVCVVKCAYSATPAPIFAAGSAARGHHGGATDLGFVVPVDTPSRENHLLPPDVGQNVH
jgi:hypothetical protein